MARTPEEIQAIEMQMARNAEYWQQRYARLENATHLSAENYIEELEKQYKLANKSIKDKLAFFYAQFADSEGISLAAAKKLLTEDQLAEFHMSVEEYIKMGEGPNNMDPDVQRKLERASIKYRVTRLEAIDTELAAELEQLRLKNQDIAYSAVSNAYRERYYRSIYEIQKGIGVGSTFSKVDESRLHTILDEAWVGDGLNFSDRIWKNKNTLYNELANNLSQALILGQGYTETSKKFELRMGTSFSNAARVIVTESAYYASTAQEESFKELGVDKYEIVATLDNVTSEICRYMDGKVFDMSEFKAGVTAPPFHPNCRTNTCPHFDDSDLEGYTVGERAARDYPEGPTYYVPADLDYDEWYDQYVLGNPAEVPEEVIEIQMGKLDKQLPKVDFDMFKDYVDQAPNDLKTVWNRYIDGIDFGSTTSRGSYYSPFEKKIYIDLDRSRKPRIDYRDFQPIEMPHEVAFHEMGHNFDFYIAEDHGITYESYFKKAHNGRADKLIEEDVLDSMADYMVDNFTDFFPKKLTTAQITSIDKSDPSLKELATKFRKDEITLDDLLANEKVKLGLASKRNIQRQLRRGFIRYVNDNFNSIERFAVSDIYEKHLKVKYPFGGGHGLSYWKTTAPSEEGFAEIFAAVMTNDEDAIRAFKKFTPKTFAYFFEIMGELVNEIK